MIGAREKLKSVELLLFTLSSYYGHTMCFLIYDSSLTSAPSPPPQKLEPEGMVANIRAALRDFIWNCLCLLFLIDDGRQRDTEKRAEDGGRASTSTSTSTSNLHKAQNARAYIFLFSHSVRED